MGGLSVWREVRQRLPHESVVYLADGKNCPYGDRTKEEIAALTRAAVVELIARGVKLIVVACNTATAVAIDSLREEFDIPFVGMEPAVKPAALATKTGTIGILATRASLAGELFLATSAKYASDVEILPVVGEGFVEAVESDMEQTSEVRERVAEVLTPLIEAGADQIVLGCTHYPFLEGVMRGVIGERDVTLVNPAPAVARRVEWLLEQGDMVASEEHKAEYSFVTFGGEKYLARITEKAMEIATQDDNQ
ncbi:MAG: glutamate racemase [Tidjanibacter sp.]|nr:glutamate racemase [Tidjanibacter sp.]